MRAAVVVFVGSIPLAACSTAGGSGARWFAPATWFSSAPAAASDRAEKNEDANRHAVVKAAQRTAHETAGALAAAPASVPVAVAADANASTVALLDQAAGPLKAGEVEKIRANVAGLISEDPKKRAAAEKERAKEKDQIAALSANLERAEAKSERAAADLRAAFTRENELANELRAQRALFWIAGVVAVLVGAAFLYLRFALGGMPSAIGRGLAALRAKSPDAADAATQIFDSYLNRGEQERIRRHSQ